MRKKTINPISANISPSGKAWLDLQRLAQVEITSESAAHPIESALTPGFPAGWQAGEPGEQTIRLVFDHPLSLRRIRLKRNRHAHRSLCCAGDRRARSLPETLCASNIRSVRLAPPKKSRTTGLNSTE
jgi:hypothetical protein